MCCIFEPGKRIISAVLYRARSSLFLGILPVDLAKYNIKHSRIFNFVSIKAMTLTVTFKKLVEEDDKLDFGEDPHIQDNFRNTTLKKRHSFRVNSL